MKKHRKGRYTTLLTEGRLNEYLHAIDIRAHELLNDIISRLAQERILAAIRYGDDEAVVTQKIQIVSKYLTKVLSWRVWNHWMISQSSLEPPIYELCKKIRDKDMDELQAIFNEDPIELS